MKSNIIVIGTLVTVAASYYAHIVAAIFQHIHQQFALLVH